MACRRSAAIVEAIATVPTRAATHLRNPRPDCWWRRLDPYHPRHANSYSGRPVQPLVAIQVHVDSSGVAPQFAPQRPKTVRNRKPNTKSATTVVVTTIHISRYEFQSHPFLFYAMD